MFPDFCITHNNVLCCRVCVSWFDRLNKGLGQPGYGRWAISSCHIIKVMR